MKLLQDANVGKNIQRIRNERGMTQVQVVALLQVRGSNLSETAYSKLEGGHRNLFVTDLLRLRDIFDAGIEEFFKDIDYSGE